MKKKALIILAEGFEETEAVIPIDVLRRAEVEVSIAGLTSTTVKGSHGITVGADMLLRDCNEEFDAVILPGGSPGAENLANSLEVKDIVRQMDTSGRMVAAICAAPALVLAPSGILKGRKATCFPGLEHNFYDGVKFLKEDVVKDGNVITSRGAGTAFAFAITIAGVLVGKLKAGMIAEQMLVNR